MQRHRIVSFLIAVTAFSSPAGAANIPFFSAYPEIDHKTWYISDGWANGDHQSCEWRADAISVKDNHIVLTLSDNGGKVRPIGCPEMHTQAVTGYGTYEVRIKTAAGSGLNTAFFTYIGSTTTGTPYQDEIDFEFLGKNPKTVQVNYFRKGQTQDGTEINLGFDASAGFHTYSFVWEPGKIRWYADGKLIHETPASKIPFIPKMPGYTFLSLWSGSAIEDDWMGHFTYQKPVSAEVAWVKFSPLNP